MNARVLSVLIVLISVFTITSCKPKEKLSETAVSVPSSVQTTPSDEISTTPDTLIYYRRGACFGMCPIFSFVLYTDGTAYYKGINHVNRIGSYQASIQDTALVNVFHVAESIGYFGMQEVYDNPSVTDLPSIELALRKDNVLKRVKCRYKAPASVNKLYDALEQMIDRQAWERIATNE